MFQWDGRPHNRTITTDAYDAVSYPIHDSGSEEISSMGYLEKCPKPDGRLDRPSANNNEVADPPIMSNLWAGKAGIKQSTFQHAGSLEMYPGIRLWHLAQE